MNREEATQKIKKLIDAFRQEFPNGGAFAAIQVTGGVSFINEIYDTHEAEVKAKDERIAELEAKQETIKEYCREQIDKYEAYNSKIKYTDMEYHSMDGQIIAYGRLLNKMEQGQ